MIQINMLFIKLVLFFLLSFFTVSIAHSFDKISISYSHNMNSEKNIELNFYGYQPNTPINILSGQEPEEMTDDLEAVFSFFQKMYRVNSTEQKSEALKLWTPSLRESLDKEFDADYYQQNQARFKELEAINLHLLIDYDDVWVVFISFDSDNVNDDWIIAHQIIKIDDNYFLTNILDEEYFVKHISDRVLGINMELAEKFYQEQE